MNSHSELVLDAHFVSVSVLKLGVYLYWWENRMSVSFTIAWMFQYTNEILY